MNIYWAAPFFDAPWLEYNARCVALLRRKGFDVALPQEQAFNSPDHDPTAEAIFDGDLADVKRCDVLVAVLDGIEIDSGVAAEAGLAYAYGIPVVGLYTDLRQNRKGEGRSYKNLFVIGLVRRSGGIITREQELPGAIAKAAAESANRRHAE